MRRTRTTPAPKGESIRALLARDGNGYPIIMMTTRYAWAWEYVNDALKETDLRVSDRDREVGIFYLRVPDRYELGRGSAAETQSYHQWHPGGGTQ